MLSATGLRTVKKKIILEARMAAISKGIIYKTLWSGIGKGRNGESEGV